MAGFIEDDFTDETLGAHWTWIDPQSGGTLDLDGRHAKITVAAGTHSFDGSSLNAPRIQQDILTNDFDLYAKVDSVIPRESFRQHGIALELSDGARIRFEQYADNNTHWWLVGVYSSGGAFTSLRSATPKNVSGYGTEMPGPVSHMRVMRTAGVWSFQFSPDGFDWWEFYEWTDARTADAFALYAGNSNGPQHTARWDLVLEGIPTWTWPTLTTGATLLDHSFPGASGALDSVVWDTDTKHGASIELNNDRAHIHWGDNAPSGEVGARAMSKAGLGTGYRLRAKFWINPPNDTAKAWVVFAWRGTDVDGDMYSPDSGYVLELNDRDGESRIFRVHETSRWYTDPMSGLDLMDLYHELTRGGFPVYGDWALEEWHWLEVEHVDHWLRIRLWPDGSSPPAEWLIEVIDGAQDEPGEVFFGLGGNWMSADHDAASMFVDQVTVEALTVGDPDPTEPVPVFRTANGIVLGASGLFRPA